MPHRRTLHPIPAERLPRGLVDRLDNPPVPVEPRPAATVILLRPADPAGGLQVLLLRRTRAAGFVPGAWVFPGGRIDDADRELARSLGTPREAPALAALREAFEETGILLVRGDARGKVLTTSADPGLEADRQALLQGESTLQELLRRRSVALDIGATTRIAHWITPEVEPRRYDTHFLAAAVPASTPAHVDQGEIVEARWMDPGQARQEHEAGRLPMVLPTVRTLELLTRFRSPDAVLEYHREREVIPVLPRFVRTAEGIALEVEQPRSEGTGDGGP